MGKSKKIVQSILSVCLGCMMIFGICFMLPNKVKAEVIFTEENPEFDFIHYDTDPNGVRYPAQSTYSHPETEKYTITTNTYVCWWDQDDVAILYKNYWAKYGDQGKLTVEVTVENMYASDEDGNPKSGAIPHDNASSGIIIRSGNGASAASVFLHCRKNQICIVYRTADGKGTSVSKLGEAPEYPVQLKLEKEGNAFIGYYKTKSTQIWQKLKAVYAEMDEQVMVGVAAHSCEQNLPVTAIYKNFSVVIEGPEGSEYGVEEEPEKDMDPIPYDPPVGPTTLLQETFTDGSITEEEESITNPIWMDKSSSISTKAYIVTEEDGNRVWWRRFVSDKAFAGNEEWTDYSLSADYKFAEESNPDEENLLTFFVRHREVDPYGYYDYQVSLSDGNKLQISKRHRAGLKNLQGSVCKTTTIDNYLDGQWHTIEIFAVDNTVTVLIDEIEKLSYSDDEKMINAKGSIGLYSSGASVYLDNIIVRSYEDIVGGDFDNKIGGNWDQPIPDYIKNWSWR